MLNFVLSQLIGLGVPLLTAFAYGGLTGGALTYVEAHPLLLFLYPLVQQAAREILNNYGVAKPTSTAVPSK